MHRQIDRAYLDRRFALATALLVAVLLLGWGVGLSALRQQRGLADWTLALAHLSDGVSRLEIDKHHVVDDGEEWRRPAMARTLLDLAHHADLIDAAVGDGGSGGTISPLLRDLVADHEPMHRHRLADARPPAAFAAAWRGGGDRPGIAALVAAHIARIEPLALGLDTPLARAEAWGAALEAALHADMSMLADDLREASIQMAMAQEAAGVQAAATLAATVATSVLAALGNLLFLLTPLRRRVLADAAALSAALDRANAAARAKTEFLATMSHELRTPLNGVLGMTAVLKATPLDARQRACADVIQSSGEALVSVIRDILDYSRLDSTRIGVDAAPFAIDAVARAPARKLAPAATLKGLDFVVRVDPDAPSRLLGDLDKIDHVVSNLLSNAVKFTRTGGVTVDVSAKPKGGRAVLRVTVRDTGPGVPVADRARIFDLFVQADQSETRCSGGVGLGLTICRRLTELMGGSLGVSDPPEGSGALFWVEIPLPVVDGSRCVAPDPRLGGRRLLLVTASADRRRYAMEALAALGATAEAAGDVSAALSIAQGAGFDAVLIDHTPPALDACAAGGAFARAGVTTPLVALAAESAFLDCAGFASRVEKPFSPNPLADAVAAALAPATPVEAARLGR